MSYLIDFFGTWVLTYSQVISWYNIYQKKFCLKKYNLHLKIFILSIMIFLSHNFCIGFIKGALTTFIGVIFCKNILEIKLKDSIIVAFIGQLIVIVCEGILVGLGITIFNLSMDYIASIGVSFIFDILMFILILCISKIVIFTKMSKWIINTTNYLKINQILILIMFVVLGSNIFGATIYYKNNFIIALLLNILISVVYTVIVALIFKYQYKYYYVNSKYNMSLESLKMQESMVNEYRIINHENKNQLLSIKGMVHEKEAIRYINSLISQKDGNKKRNLNQIIKIPEGGIRGLIFGKMCYMDEKNIKYIFNIDNKIKTEEIIKIDSNDMVDICQILGVFIDNAIDETIKHKDKTLSIDFHKTDISLVISITNYHQNMDLITKANHSIKSTKGNGHGYGLQLVDKILNKNKNLKNNRIITKDTFTQQLIIK